MEKYPNYPDEYKILSKNTASSIKDFTFTTHKNQTLSFAEAEEIFHQYEEFLDMENICNIIKNIREDKPEFMPNEKAIKDYLNEYQNEKKFGDQETAYDNIKYDIEMDSENGEHCIQDFKAKIIELANKYNQTTLIHEKGQTMSYLQEVINCYNNDIKKENEITTSMKVQNGGPANWKVAVLQNKEVLVKGWIADEKQQNTKARSAKQMPAKERIRKTGKVIEK